MCVYAIPRPAPADVGGERRGRAGKKCGGGSGRYFYSPARGFLLLCLAALPCLCDCGACDESWLFAVLVGVSPCLGPATARLPRQPIVAGILAASKRFYREAEPQAKRTWCTAFFALSIHSSEASIPPVQQSPQHHLISRMTSSQPKPGVAFAPLAARAARCSLSYRTNGAHPPVLSERPAVARPNPERVQLSHACPTDMAVNCDHPSKFLLGTQPVFRPFAVSCKHEKII